MHRLLPSLPESPRIAPDRRAFRAVQAVQASAGRAKVCPVSAAAKAARQQDKEKCGGSLTQRGAYAGRVDGQHLLVLPAATGDRRVLRDAHSTSCRESSSARDRGDDGAEKDARAVSPFHDAPVKTLRAASNDVLNQPAPLFGWSARHRHPHHSANPPPLYSKKAEEGQENAGGSSGGMQPHTLWPLGHTHTPMHTHTHRHRTLIKDSVGRQGKCPVRFTFSLRGLLSAQAASRDDTKRKEK